MRSGAATFLNISSLFRRGYMRELGTSLISVGVILLLSSAMLLSVDVASLRANFGWVQRTDEALLQIGEVEFGLMGMEASGRGYALTGDSKFQGYSQSEHRQVTRGMAKLASLVADDTKQTSRLAALQAPIDRRVAILVRLATYGPSRADEAGAEIRDHANREVMRIARDGLAQLRASEMDILAARQRAAEEETARSYTLAMGLLLGAFVLVALGVGLRQRERSPQSK